MHQRFQWYRPMERGRRRSLGSHQRVGAFVALGFVALVACGGASRSGPPPAVAPRQPQNAAALCDTGQAQLEQHDYKAAADSLDRCIQADPARAYAYYYAGLAYQQLGDIGSMADRFERFLKLAPDDAPERPRVEAILRSIRE